MRTKIYAATALCLGLILAGTGLAIPQSNNNQSNPTVTRTVSKPSCCPDGACCPGPCCGAQVR